MDALPLDTAGLAACAAGVLAAYVIFGLTSFGAPLISAPILAHFLPLPTAIPLQSTLDLAASALLGGKERQQVDWKEIRWLMVPMLVGMVLGATLLIGLPKRASLLALGAFVALYGAAGLADRLRLPPLPRPLAFGVVVIGGLLSSLFAAGGPVYAMHLTNRISDPVTLRSSFAAAALVSAVLRVVVFAASGLMASKALWLAVALFLPGLVVGTLSGRWLMRKLSPRINRALIYALLVASGLSLIWRFA